MVSFVEVGNSKHDKANNKVSLQEFQDAVVSRHGGSMGIPTTVNQYADFDLFEGTSNDVSSSSPAGKAALKAAPAVSKAAPKSAG